MNLEKIRVITEWFISKSVKKIESFLRFINFYQKFIQNYSKIAALLTDIIKKKQELL